MALRLPAGNSPCRTARLAAGADLAPLVPFALGILGSSTLDFLAEALPAAAARHGVALHVTLAPYDQVMQQALDPASVIRSAGCSAVLVAVDHRWLKLDRPAFASGGAAGVEAGIAHLRSIVDILRAAGTQAIVQTIPQPPSPLFGSHDRAVGGSVRAMVDDANRAIVQLARETGSALLDLAALAEQVGTQHWFDPVQWSAYKMASGAQTALVHADTLARLLGALLGRSRKCLVLDLDNTVWGGVIGDDGLAGIRIGQGDAVGEAFLAVQQMALDLRARGVILAVSSKNTDAVARQPFGDHPDMLLRESDIAVFQANWSDKPGNLVAIAKTLNIGLDALVFLDDNPAERAQMRAALPMVAVPELPDDPNWYPRYLAAAGYFEAVSFSAEDGLRAQSYGLNAQRAEVLAHAGNQGDYLASLGMILGVAGFDQQGRGRITQLINKTNQFNLTTRRYSEQAVADMELDPAVCGLQFRLRDRFGDLGMIAVIVCRADPDCAVPGWSIDSWLMSCRVLGRKVEEAMLDRLVARARVRGVAQLTATYVPTAKNAMVRDMYGALGFACTAEAAGGARHFVLDLGDWRAAELPMAIEDNPRTG